LKPTEKKLLGVKNFSLLDRLNDTAKKFSLILTKKKQSPIIYITEYEIHKKTKEIVSKLANHLLWNKKKKANEK